MREFRGPAYSFKARSAIVGTIILLGLFLLSKGPSQVPRLSNVLRPSKQEAIPPEADLDLPDLYQSNGEHHDAEESESCSERYGADYIRAFSKTATNMCESNASATLTCFTHQAWADHSDTFCAGSPASIYDQNVYMQCPLHAFRPLHDFTDDDSRAHMIHKIPFSWYNTGARYVFEKYIKIDNADIKVHSQDRDRIALLVKREGGNVITNAWHQLMQVMSLGISLDVMRITLDPNTGRPMYTDEDYHRTQVVILDDEAEGPFFETWNMFGALPTIRLKNSIPFAPSQIVIPLNGGVNPLWMARSLFYEECSESALLRTFVRRILKFYKLPMDPPATTDRITLGFIDRRKYRVIREQEQRLTALRKLLAEKYPHVTLEVIDFGKVGTFREQIEKARSIDILVGAHGAALTHTLWLPPQSTVVEIQPPSLHFFGFEVLARFMGHGYFQQAGYKQEYAGMTHNWQADDIFITEEGFLKVIETAIQKRTWQEDYHDRRLGFPKDS